MPQIGQEEILKIIQIYFKNEKDNALKNPDNFLAEFISTSMTV